MVKGIIDRFKGKFAVVEIGGITKDFPKSIFPKSASVGDVAEIIGEKVKVTGALLEQR
ncbi:DUF3006 domain-containing protein [Neobacillus drentensis]|uniref:DUF3006 domain-containing protein n=1 Tax=Neobacillus drentensis TaxID=220684 RepID=UPI00300027E1